MTVKVVVSNKSTLTVLVPLDGSPHAERALAYLPILARTGKLTVLLMAVVDERQSFFATLSESLRERESNVLAAYLDSKAKELAGSASSVETMVAVGSPASTILDEAERSSADLLLVSTHGRSGSERWQWGSVADKVIRGASCNTLVIGPETDGARPGISSILVPLDGSKHAEEALVVARPLAESLGAQVQLLTVVPPVLLVTRYEDLRQQLLDEGIARANEYLGSLRAQFGDVKVSVRTGPPEQSISEFIRENSIDLVVMTSHGRGGFSRTVLGSATDRLLRGRAPVLVVRN